MMVDALPVRLVKPVPSSDSKMTLDISPLLDSIGNSEGLTLFQRVSEKDFSNGMR